MARLTVYVITSIVAILTIVWGAWQISKFRVEELPPPNPLAQILQNRFDESVAAVSQDFADQILPTVQETKNDLPNARSAFRKLTELILLDFDTYLSRFSGDQVARSADFTQQIRKAFEDTYGRVLQPAQDLFEEEKQHLVEVLLLSPPTNSVAPVTLASTTTDLLLRDIDRQENLAINIACDAGSWVPWLGLAVDGAELTGVRSNLMYGDQLDNLTSVADQQARSVLNRIETWSQPRQIEIFCRTHFNLARAISAFEE